MWTASDVSNQSVGARLPVSVHSCASPLAGDMSVNRRCSVQPQRWRLSTCCHTIYTPCLAPVVSHGVVCGDRGWPQVGGNARACMHVWCRGDFGPDVAFINASLGRLFALLPVDSQRVGIAGEAQPASHFIHLHSGLICTACWQVHLLAHKLQEHLNCGSTSCELLNTSCQHQGTLAHR